MNFNIAFFVDTTLFYINYFSLTNILNEKKKVSLMRKGTSSRNIWYGL